MTAKWHNREQCLWPLQGQDITKLENLCSADLAAMLHKDDTVNITAIQHQLCQINLTVLQHEIMDIASKLSMPLMTPDKVNRHNMWYLLLTCHPSTISKRNE